MKVIQASLNNLNLSLITFKKKYLKKITIFFFFFKSFKMENRMPGMNTTWAPAGPMII